MQVTAMDANRRETADFSATPDDGAPAGPDDARAESPPGGSSRRSSRFVYAGGDRPLPGYVIKRGIGQGGFGEIYYALSDAGKEVALKLIRRNLDIELRGIRQCLNLKHPNLLALHDIRKDAEGDTWVVMEYVGGENLDDALAAHPEGMPLPMALAWFHGLAAGVGYLHDRGLVHRDIKPGNVFSDEGIVKVGDYGLSKFISCSRRSGQTESVGTVHYMAPEVAGGRYGREIDIYAMGIILHELLTGRVPFDGETVGEVLMKHLTAQPNLEALGEPYRSVIAKALKKDPAERYDTVEAMLADLPIPNRIPAGGVQLPSQPGASAGANDNPGSPGTQGSDNAGQWAPAWAAEDDEEPVLRAVRRGARSLLDAWHRANLNTPARVVLILVGLFVLLSQLGTLIPALIALAVVYAGYRLVRWLALPPKGAAWAASPSAVATPPPSPQPPPVHRNADARHKHRRRWHRTRDEAVQPLLVRSPKERLAELLTAMLLSAPIVLIGCAVIMLIVSYGGHVPTPEQVTWLGCVALAGTWAVLLPAKYWEGTTGEPLVRRLLMLVIGLALGCLAFGLGEFLLVDLPPSSQFPPPPDYRLPPSFYAPDGSPLGPAFIAVFGTLLALMRWWQQADPLRSARLRFWPVIISMLAAGLVAALWHFPQPWLPMVAAVMSLAVQLASPWVPQHERVKRLDN